MVTHRIAFMIWVERSDVFTIILMVTWQQNFPFPINLWRKETNIIPSNLIQPLEVFRGMELILKRENMTKRMSLILPREKVTKRMSLILAKRDKGNGTHPTKRENDKEDGTNPDKGESDQGMKVILNREKVPKVMNLILKFPEKIIMPT